MRINVTIVVPDEVVDRIDRQQRERIRPAVLAEKLLVRQVVRRVIFHEPDTITCVADAKMLESVALARLRTTVADLQAVGYC